MTTLFALLVAALAGVDGVLFMRLFFANASLKMQLSFGAVLGMVALSWTGFLLSLGLGLNGVSISLTIAIFVACFIILFIKNQVYAKTRNHQEKVATRWTLDAVFYFFWLIFFAWIFSRVITIEADGLYTSPANNYGDLPFHLSVITSFSDGDNFPPYNPIFQGLKFTYPFLIDFLTAFLYRTGADWAAAFFIPNIILIMALVGIIELLTEKLTGSKIAARIAPFLFFFSGGLGFTYFLQDFQNSNVNWWDFLQHLPNSYTKNDALNLQWGNMLTTLMIPQRSLLLGIPVFAMIVILWWEGLKVMSDEQKVMSDEWKVMRNEERKLREPNVFPLITHHSSLITFPSSLLFAGILAGLLPMLHAHGFFAIMMVSAAMALVFFSWDWLAFFIPAGILSLPQAWWLSGTGTRSSLFKFNFGWMPGEYSLFKFYYLNFGLVLFVLALAFFFTSLRTHRFYWPFVLCFIIPNLVLLAPWPWDNIKVLLYWYLVSCVLIAGFLAQLWTRKLFPIGAVLMILLMLSGGLDIARGLSPIEKVRLFESDQLKVAELIKHRIPPQALMLSAPIHNSVLALSGRQMLMGYPGHLWTHGVNFEERERDVKTIYLGGAEAEKLLTKYAIDFVIVGPTEYKDLNADEGFFANRFSVVIDEAGYRVYKCR